jgi:hypothetical protein
VLTADTWLVAYEGTTKSLAEKLGIRSGEVGTGVVFPISNYSGRASSDTWEWLGLNVTRDTI